MEAAFSKVLSMSLSAGFVIAAVLLLRLLLKKAPRKYSYILWLLVFFRLLCPVTIPSPLSLIPVKEDAIFYQSGDTGGSMRIDTGIPVVDTLLIRGADRLSEAGDIPLPETLSNGHSNRATVLYTGAGILWIAGMVGLLAYGLIQILRLRYLLKTAVLASGGGVASSVPVYESAYIQTAFLFGHFHPRIYLPVGIGKERSFVIAHECIHRKRLDYLVKPICYLAVVLHWFNPLVWLAFHLMNKDMEISCDEQVLKNAGEDIRSAYSASLLNLSVKGSGLSMPLAFGESGTKERIKHVLKYKKPSVWIGVGAILVVLAASITLLTTNGRGGWVGGFGEAGLSGNESGELSEEEFYRYLSENRNPYIGDASANGRLIGILPGLVSYEWDGMELQTDEEPYELTLCYKKTEPITVDEELANTEIMMKNILYLFATIENMDSCTYYLTEDGIHYPSETEGSVPSGEKYTATRQDMEQIYGPLYEKSKTPEGLRQLEADYQAYLQKMKAYLNSLGLPEHNIWETDFTIVPATGH